MNPRMHPHLRRLWMKYHYPLTNFYTAGVATYIAIGLHFGWF